MPNCIMSDENQSENEFEKKFPMEYKQPEMLPLKQFDMRRLILKMKHSAKKPLITIAVITLSITTVIVLSLLIFLPNREPGDVSNGNKESSILSELENIFDENSLKTCEQLEDVNLKSVHTYIIIFGFKMSGAGHLASIIDNHPNAFVSHDSRLMNKLVRADLQKEGNLQSILRWLCKKCEYSIQLTAGEKLLEGIDRVGKGNGKWSHAVEMFGDEQIIQPSELLSSNYWTFQNKIIEPLVDQKKAR